MGRSPCYSKGGLNRGAWSAHEDQILREYIRVHGEGRWRNLPKRAGLKRCGKSCRLRWLNYLRPDIKRGNISPDEEDLIIRLHRLLGNRWSLIAGRLPGRTDNEIKNYWNTRLSKKVKDHHQSTTRVTPVSAPSYLESPVVRTKATKCSKVLFVNPFPHSSMQLQNMYMAEGEAKPHLVDDAANNLTSNQTESSMRDDGFLSYPIAENELSTDSLIDLNMEEIYLSDDLLNWDVSVMCDFS